MTLVVLRKMSAGMTRPVQAKRSVVQMDVDTAVKNQSMVKVFFFKIMFVTIHV